jgi:cytochrome c553
MKTVLKLVGGLVALVVVGALGMFLWAKSATASKLAQTYETHSVDFPIPFPLTEAEIDELRKEKAAELAAQAGEDEATGGDDEAAEGEDEGADSAQGEDDAAEEAAEADAEGDAPEEAAADAAADPLEGVDLQAIALERAIERGKHLVNARYACIECHGKNFGGGVMIDDPAMGQLLGPNITAGKGGKTAGYTAADWDRIVRHGVKPDGKPAAMPSEDFQLMSDRELSDIIAYLRTVPPVDNEVAPPSLGPVGTFLMATGGLPLSANVVPDHHAKHDVLPPTAEPTPEFGKHLAGVCTGCHRASFVGGPIPVGPPDWPPARNLTPHEQGLAGWTYEQFVKAMREAVRPDGTPLKPPMTLMAPYAQNMQDVELQALWAYIQSLPPQPTGT